MTAKRMRLLTACLAIIALIAALFVINPGLGTSAAAAWDGKAAEDFEGGSGDSSDPYIIKTAEQLAFLAEQVNGGKTYQGKYFQLVADLDLSGSEWNPIGIGERETGGGTVTKPFAGTFDGNNNIISGLTLTAGLDGQGLFGCSSGTIRNLGIESGNISIGSAEKTGAICGYSTGTIENCWNSADITGSTEGGKYVGGICGYSTGTISGCLNMGNITANSFIGGICGNTAKGTQISNCFNSGSITGKEQIGGIAGINLNYITFCINAGELTGETKVYAVSHSDVNGNENARIANSYYNSDVFSSASGDNEAKGISTGALCGSIDKYNRFDENIWESGSIVPDGSGKAQMTYVRLKNIPAAPAAMEREVFNFGTESDPDWDTYTLITEAQQFVDIGADKAKWNQNYVLGNDIDLESRKDVKVIENFNGKFIGNGHSIKNVYINEPEKSQVALFGEVNSGSVIRDLTLDGGSIYGKESVAGIAVVNNGSLINCTNSCSVSGDIGDIGYIGGVCAYNEGTLISCRNTGSVSCTAGTHDEGRTTGGVCGGSSGGKIENCYNSGTVESPKQAGGVCGSSSGGEIENCYNSGAVSGTENVGGICGEGNYGSKISGCFNSGEVTGIGNIGGICGSVSGDEYNGHEIFSSVSGCANTGKVSGSGSLGSVCGNGGDHSSFTNCIYSSGSGPTAIGGKDDVSGSASSAPAEEVINSFKPESWTDGYVRENVDGRKKTILRADPVPAGAKQEETRLEYYNFGTEASPDWDSYTEISTERELLALAGDNTKWGGNYVLAGDIQLKGGSFSPIGTETVPFSGKFSGNGHVLNNVKISGNSDYSGLFGYNTGTITYVGIESGEIYGGNCTGSICGMNAGTITGCYNNAPVTGKESAGGVCGKNSGTVQMSYNTGAVTGILKTGGVCGESTDGSTLANCYNTGMLVGDSFVGGICGSAGSSADVYYSFSMAEICGNSKVGGIVGTGSSTTCYYSNDLFLVNEFGGPVKTQNLTSRQSDFSGDIWETGSYTTGTANGRYRTDNYTLISLKGVGKAQSGELRMYNYFTLNSDSWRYYNPITTADEFEKLTQNSAMWRRNYVLQSDIDLSGRNITPIGNEVTPFYAFFSGDGHKISNLIINQPDSDNVGLFGYVSGWVYDIITENGSISGRNNVGGIIGHASDTKGRCVNGNAVSGVRNVGGICGESSTTTIDCINIGTVTGTDSVGAICGTKNKYTENCWYNSDTSGAKGIAGADLEGAAQGLTTLRMTSADALTTMGLNSTLWTKKANDKAAGIAYYPSLREDSAPSIGYKSGVILENSSADSPAYLGTADLTVYSLVKFNGMPQAYSKTALTAGSGSFTVTLNDKEVVAATALPDGAKTNVTTSALPAAGDDCRFVLNYSGADSSFIADTSADCTVKVEKLALTAADLEFSPPSYLKYNGAAKEAEITVKPGITGAGDITLKYYRDGAESDPVIPGTYTVTADVADGENYKAAVLSGGWEFTIAKGDITADLFKFTAPEDCRYNGEGKPVSVTVNDGAEGVGEITLHYLNSTSGEITVPVKPETIKVLIDVAEGEYYNAASGIGGWLYTIYYGTPAADDFIFHAPADTEYTGLPLAAAVEARRFSDGSETGMGEITAVKYYLDGVPTEPIAPGTYTVKIDVAKSECYLAASDVTSPDWTFTITPAALTASGSGTASGTFGGSLGSLSVSGLKAMLGTDEIPGRWALSGGDIPNVGDTGKYTAVFTADVHPEYYKPLTADVTLDIAKAQAPAMADTALSCHWGSREEKSVSLGGLPENAGEIFPASIAVTDVNGILAADSARYSDGKLYFTLGENTEESIGNTAEITVTLPTQNYADFTFRITVTLAAKGDQQAPLQSDFRMELTSTGSNITAEIVTGLSGVEFSFDGSDWGSENAAPVGHDELVTGYIRFAETDSLNPSQAVSLTLKSGHGELTRHDRSEPDCISDGNAEYWECGLCTRYFLDEAGTQETALQNVVLAKTGHTPGEAVRENEIPAACTVDGSYDEAIYCTVCSEKISTEHKTIPATGHTPGEAVRENEIPAACTVDGSYDEVIYCTVCGEKLSTERRTVPAAGHKWSEKYESDKSGHWHICEVCGAVSDIEDHVSGGAATYAKPELCTVCGYEMSPRKSSSGGNSSGGTARPSRPAAVTETQPGINGVQKSWADIAADLMKQGGGSAVISLNGETTVPADVIKAIADSRIKAEFITDSIKSWIIDGAAINSASAADLTALPGNADRSGLRGVFGADLKISGTVIPAELKLTFRREFADQFANVYRLTEGGLEFQCCARIAEDGTAEIPGAYTGGEYVVMVCEYSDLPGDFSNDGILNALDAAMILKDIVGYSKGENPRMADFNGDGVMNALDASAILMAIVAE